MKLVVKDLKKSFGSNEVLKGLNFEFEPGKIYALLGRNGAGKTTFFNCLNEDLEVDSGEYYIEEDNKNRKIAPDEIGYVLSTPTVPDFLTGKESEKALQKIILEDIPSFLEELGSGFTFIKNEYKIKLGNRILLR